MLDEDFANFINATNDAWINYENGDEDGYLAITNEYLRNSDRSNLIKECFLQTTVANCYDTSIRDIDRIEELYNELSNNIVTPLYNSYCDYI